MSQFGLPEPNDNVLEDDISDRFHKQHYVGVIMAPSPLRYSMLTLLLGQLLPPPSLCQPCANVIYAAREIPSPSWALLPGDYRWSIEFPGSVPKFNCKEISFIITIYDYVLRILLKGVLFDDIYLNTYSQYCYMLFGSPGKCINFHIS